MAFSYVNNNTVEWVAREDNIIIKMAVIDGDNDLAKVWFENSEGQVIGRGQYLLRRDGINGEVAPYIGDNYILDYRKNYVMVAPGGAIIFMLNHQKQQAWFTSCDYIVRWPDWTIRSQRIANAVEQELEQHAD